MFYKRRETKTGKIRFEVGDSYKDPLTGKWKTASVSYYKDTSTARKKAEFELQEKLKIYSMLFNQRLMSRQFSPLKI